MADTGSILTGGTNNFETTAAHLNAPQTDFISEGVVGVITNTSGVAPATGALAVNAQGTPDMTVAVTAGTVYTLATPTGQSSQLLRGVIAGQNVTISANSTGGTRYDWIYAQVNATNANEPSAAGDNVFSLTSSRSTSASTDNGTPPTYGTLLAIVTVANGASSIANGSIADKRVRAGHTGGLVDTNGNEVIKIGATAAAVNEVTVTNAATAGNPTLSATGDDTNIHLSLTGKGTGGVLIKNPYKFFAYRNAAQNTAGTGWAKVNLDTELFDTGSNFDNATNYRFTAPITGFYQFNGNVIFNSPGSQAIGELYKNGAEYLRGAYLTAAAGKAGSAVAGLIQLTAGDYIELWVYNGGAAAAMDVGTAPISTYLSGYLVAAT